MWNAIISLFRDGFISRQTVIKLTERHGLIRRPAEPVTCFIPDDDYLIRIHEMVHRGVINRRIADELIDNHYHKVYEMNLRRAQEVIAEGEHNPRLGGFAINPNPVVRYADLSVPLRYYPIERESDRMERSQKTEDWLVRWGRK